MDKKDELYLGRRHDFSSDGIASRSKWWGRAAITFLKLDYGVRMIFAILHGRKVEGTRSEQIYVC